MDMSHNYYINFYKMGIKPFDTIANLETLYADYETHRGEWLSSISRTDFIEGQKLLKEAIDYIKSTQNNNNNGGNTMNTNETKRITIEVEVPDYENSVDTILNAINRNTDEIKVITKKIEINNNSIIEQVKGYIDAVIRPLLNKQPDIIFSGYMGSVSKKHQVIRDDATGELETIYASILYEGYYKAIRVKFHGSYGEKYFDFLVAPDKETTLYLNERISRENVAYFLARYWAFLKIAITEAIEAGKQKAMESSNNNLVKKQDILEVLEDFVL